MKSENARNTVIFIACTAVILILYQVFVMQPQADARKAAQAAAVASQQQVPGQTAGAAAQIGRAHV